VRISPTGRATVHLDGRTNVKGSLMARPVRFLLLSACLLALAAGFLAASPGAIAAPDTNPSEWDCMGTNNHNMNHYFRLSPPEVVQLINNDADPAFQVDGVAGLQRTYRSGGLVTYSPVLGEYTGYCAPHH
jgi:hypothetical protein